MVHTRTHGAVVAVLLGAAMMLSACGGSSASRAGAGTGTSTTVTASNSSEGFSTAIGALRHEIAAAGRDRCKLRRVLESLGRTGDPTTPAQARAAVDTVVGLYDQVASSLPATAGGAAQGWRDAAAVVRKAGADSHYDPKVLNQGAAFTLPASFAAATQTFGDLTAKCPGIAK